MAPDEGRRPTVLQERLDCGLAVSRAQAPA